MIAKTLISNILKMSLVAVIFFLASCTGYNKLLKSDDYELKYEKAFEYYAEGDYTRTITLLEQLIPVYRGTERFEELQYYYAYCQYNVKDYVLAGYYFRNFARTFPNSEYAEECQFMNAYCYYLESPRPSLDQESTYNAINEFQLFITQYPNSERADDCNRLIDDMREKLAEKSFISAKLYYNLEYYKSAITALRSSLQEFPATKYREEIKYMIVESAFLYAENSIPDKQAERYEAMQKEYSIFIEEFPESEYKRKVERMYEKSEEYFQNQAVTAN